MTATATIPCPAEAAPTLPSAVLHPLKVHDDPTLTWGLSCSAEAYPVQGSIIDRAYRIVAPLAQGGMGTVLLAHDEQLDRPVAVKIASTSLHHDARVRQRFLSEARTMARVRHENVVSIYAFGEHACMPFLVMEYVPGCTLREWLQQRGPLDVGEALGLLEPLCRGVQAIHEAGAVHRDIKASNVLLGIDGRIVVADFGLARLIGSDTTDPFAFEGTPSYMAPELITQARLPQTLEPRADVYALAVLAFELLTGTLPFAGKTPVEIMQRHLNTTPPRPSEVRPGLPAALDQPILRALSKSPGMRPASALELSSQLLQAQSAWERQPKWRA